MIKLKQILTEDIKLFECEVLLKTDIKYNKTDIFNNIRAVSGVVVVNVEQNDFLDNRATDQYEYSLLHIKYISKGHPADDIKKLGSKVLHGDKEYINKIGGVLQFLPRINTIERKKAY